MGGRVMQGSALGAKAFGKAENTDPTTIWIECLGFIWHYDPSLLIVGMFVLLEWYGVATPVLGH